MVVHLYYKWERVIIGDLSWFWLFCSGPVVSLLPSTFNIFGFSVFRFLVCLMKDIPKRVTCHKFDIYVFMNTFNIKVLHVPHYISCHPHHLVVSPNPWISVIDIYINMERASASVSDRIVINTTRIATVTCQLFFYQWCVRSLVCLCSSIEWCLMLMKNSLKQPF